jgi:hypothetical protein
VEEGVEEVQVEEDHKEVAEGGRGGDVGPAIPAKENKEVVVEETQVKDREKRDINARVAFL